MRRCMPATPRSPVRDVPSDSSPGPGVIAAESVLDLVRAHAGLAFASGRRAHAVEVVRRALRRAAISDGRAFRERVRHDAALLDALLEELTVGESYFFRESGQLQFIRDEVIPALARRRGGNGIRVWSAGCATGEEPYTIAILLQELGLATRSNIQATDIATDRLARAALGRFGRWSLRGVADEAVRRHFREGNGQFELSAAIRNAVRFTPLNLAAVDAVPPGALAGRMDLVLCRNVLIYFEPETVKRVARLLLGSLSEDGWLFLGASDPSLAEVVPCEVVVTGAGVAYRRVRPARVPVVPPSGPAIVAEPAPIPRALPNPLSVGEAPTSRTAPDPSCERAPTALPARERVPSCEGDEAAWIIRVRALANAGRLEEAGTACVTALDRHRTSCELLILQALLFLEAGRPREAARAARRALYLDRRSVVAQMTLGTALGRIGDEVGAQHAFATTTHLLDGCVEDAEVPMSGGETVASLRALARARLIPPASDAR